jgi:acyl-CoA reductase-like NAD-dependent aldehyde dehydrogenase
MTELLRPINPSTGEPMESLPVSSAVDVDTAISAGAAAQVEWGRDFSARADALTRFAESFAGSEAAEELAQLASQEMGKPIAAARREVALVASRMAMFVDRAREAVRDEALSERGVDVTVQWRPLGVVGVIGPWNFPVSTPNSLVVSALLTGNAVVFKPSEFTPRTGAAYQRAMAEYLPPGVFSLVQGAGEVGRALVAGDVDMIAFTGSIATGQAIMREAAASMKRLVLELGGKDPMLVLPDADLEAAADHAVAQSTHNSGQVCISTERVFVHADVAERFTEMLRERVQRIDVGNPAEDSTQLGPMVSERQRSLVEAQVAAAEADGAKVVVRGESSGPGFFLGPSLVVDVTDEMSLAQDETFGPVVAVSTYTDVDDAVDRANDTRYGLGASVWGPTEQASAVAERIEAGMIGINRGLSAAGGAPWVGWKQSGFGYASPAHSVASRRVDRGTTSGAAEVRPGSTGRDEPVAGGLDRRDRRHEEALVARGADVSAEPLGAPHRDEIVGARRCFSTPAVAIHAQHHHGIGVVVLGRDDRVVPQLRRAIGAVPRVVILVGDERDDQDRIVAQEPIVADRDRGAAFCDSLHHRVHRTLDAVAAGSDLRRAAKLSVEHQAVGLIEVALAAGEVAVHVAALETARIGHAGAQNVLALHGLGFRAVRVRRARHTGLALHRGQVALPTVVDGVGDARTEGRVAQQGALVEHPCIRIGHEDVVVLFDLERVVDRADERGETLDEVLLVGPHRPGVVDHEQEVDLLAAHGGAAFVRRGCAARRDVEPARIGGGTGIGIDTGGVFGEAAVIVYRRGRGGHPAVVATAPQQGNAERQSNRSQSKPNHGAQR